MHQQWRNVLVAVACLAFLAGRPVHANDNGMGRVPPLGWNSWCTDVSCTKDYCDEELVLTQLNAVVKEGLRDKCGWKYITLDDCWGGPRNVNGSYSWDPIRFPRGIPWLVEQVHDAGMLFGLYLASGNQTCNPGGRPYRIPGSWDVDKPNGHYTEDAQTMADWGVDYIKLDWCGFGVTPDTVGKHDGRQCGENITEDECKERRFTAFGDALNKTGKPIYLAASSMIGTPQWAPKVLNSWRIGGDHHDWWWTTPLNGWMQNSSTRQKIENLNRANNVMQDESPSEPLSGPGGWNDADFLFTGGQGCGTATGDDPVRNSTTLKAHCQMQTDTDYRTAYTMWAIGTAPLLVAVDVANMTAIERSTLLNPAVAKMHLDELGHVGKRIATDTTCKSELAPDMLGGIASCQIWAKPLLDGSVAVVLYNSEPDQNFACTSAAKKCPDGTTSNCCNVPVAGSKPHKITVRWADLKKVAPKLGSSPNVVDLWAGKDVTPSKGADSFTAEVKPSAAMLLKVTPIAMSHSDESK